MGIFGKGSAIAVGVILIALGFLVKSRLIEWLLDITGWIIIIIGIVVVVVGVVGLATGSKGRSGGF